MGIPIEEIQSTLYQEDPSIKSRYYGRYGKRKLILERIDDYHFNFIFHSDDPAVATITFKNIDLRLYMPTRPSWILDEPDLTFVTLSEREWNRQQTSFTQNSKHLLISGGDGVEKKNLESAELARNCLNAGLWEIQLFTKEKGEKALYYQGWFNLPLGYYKNIFPKVNHLSYWTQWYRLEHWVDPEGTPINLNRLRTVLEERSIPFKYDPNEPIAVQGEQLRKSRMLNAEGLRCWGDFCFNKTFRFASFVPPGRYNVNIPWKHELERIAQLDEVIYRKIKSPAAENPLDEIEFVFTHGKDNSKQRIILSGIDLEKQPQLSMRHYPKGLYMPMGIAMPPFYQSYEELQASPPHESPYFCVMLGENNSWINHHDAGIDGPVVHRDLYDPHLIHLYLLSYERETLVAHFIFDISQ